MRLDPTKVFIGSIESETSYKALLYPVPEEAIGGEEEEAHRQWSLFLFFRGSVGKELTRMNSEHYVSIGEACRRTGLSLFAIRKRIRRGDIKAYGDPTDLRIKLIRIDELERYLESRPLLPVEREAA